MIAKIGISFQGSCYQLLLKDEGQNGLQGRYGKYHGSNN